MIAERKETSTISAVEHLRKADNLMNLRNYREAFGEYTEAVKVKLSAHEAWYGLGVIFDKLWGNEKLDRDYRDMSQEYAAICFRLAYEFERGIKKESSLSEKFTPNKTFASLIEEMGENGKGFLKKKM